MRGRLTAAVAAIVAVVAVIAWGLAPRASHPATHAARKANPYQVSAVLPVDVSKMRLTFDATFTGSALNPSIWSTCYPTAADPAAGCTNYNNKEYEWYMPSQAQVYGGTLHLLATHAPTPGTTSAGSRATYQCKSGMVTSYPGMNFQYGYIQVVAKIPNSDGMWPALWLAASNLHWPPEIDILEHWGPPDPLYNSTGVFLHPVNAKPIEERFPPVNIFSGWHAFGLYWTSSQLTWYIDGQSILTVREEIPHQKMYLIANIAQYQRKIASSCSSDMQIRSVKVWQQ